jgi:hypothetical protein
MARSLNRNALNVEICFALWQFRGGVEAPPIDLGWSGLPVVWPGQRTALRFRARNGRTQAGRRA